MDYLTRRTLSEWLILNSKHGNRFTSFIEKQGIFWAPKDLPIDIQKRRLGYCFWQAHDLALSRLGCLTYVEGYAFCPYDLRHPVSHAWCVDKFGNVVDPTWSEPSKCTYAGIPFRDEVLRETNWADSARFVQLGYLGTPGFFEKVLGMPNNYLMPKDSYDWTHLSAA